MADVIVLAPKCIDKGCHRMLKYKMTGIHSNNVSKYLFKVHIHIATLMPIMSNQTGQTDMYVIVFIDNLIR